MAMHQQEAGVMTILSMRTLGLAAMLMLVAVPAATAGQEPVAEERIAIEEVLRAHGFESWKAIEREDDDAVWEVDDAYHANGQKYDLELKFQVIDSAEEEPPTQGVPNGGNQYTHPDLDGVGEGGIVDQSREEPGKQI
jgi:hypothetical protein